MNTTPSIRGLSAMQAFLAGDTLYGFVDGRGWCMVRNQATLRVQIKAALQGEKAFSTFPVFYSSYNYGVK